MRQVIAIIFMLTLTTETAVGQESVAYDSVQGLYHVYYLDMTDSGVDTLVYGAVFSGKAADPIVTATVSEGVVGSTLRFSYTLTNGPDGD